MIENYTVRDCPAVRVVRSWGQQPKGAIITTLSPTRREQLLRAGFVVPYRIKKKPRAD